METALARSDQSDDRIELIKKTVAEKADLSDLELQLFLHVAKRTGLDPLLKQIHVLKDRRGKISFIIGIDGFRLIASRSPEYVGQASRRWAGEDLVWRKAWIERGNPSVARAGVRRSTFAAPIYEVATWRSYGRDEPAWRQYPDVMLGKVAEAHAIRKAFPAELAGLYAPEEFHDDRSALEPAPVDPIAERMKIARSKIAAFTAEKGKQWCADQVGDLDRTPTLENLETIVHMLERGARAERTT